MALFPKEYSSGAARACGESPQETIKGLLSNRTNSEKTVLGKRRLVGRAYPTTTDPHHLTPPRSPPEKLKTTPQSVPIIVVIVRPKQQMRMQ